jgi:hypothetical protein
MGHCRTISPMKVPNIMNSEMEDVDWNIFCDWNTLSGQDICSAIQMLMMTNQNIVKSDWD